MNYMKNVEARYEVLENMNVIEKSIKGEETCNAKEYLLALTVDGKKCL